MNSLNPPSDEELLSALAARLQDRRHAQELAASAAADLLAMNARLESAERLKSQFLSNIRNEINNPLTVVRGFAAEIANRPTLPPADLRTMAVAIFREVGKLSFQMSNIFAAADFESGLVRPNWARVNVTTLLRDVVDDFQSQAGPRRIALQLECQSKPALIVKTDPHLLELTVANLLSNAVAFTPDGKTVQVRAFTDAETITVEVQDDGPGIPEEDLERIFDRFVQLSTGSQKCHGGHGLGLAVVRACAETLGGKIEVGASPGVGSIFRLVLPRQRECPTDESASSGNGVIFDVVEVL